MLLERKVWCIYLGKTYVANILACKHYIHPQQHVSWISSPLMFVMNPKEIKMCTVAFQDLWLPHIFHLYYFTWAWTYSKSFGGSIPARFGRKHFSLRSQVHRTAWWMLHYGGPTPKRHVAWSNSPHISFLDLGKLRGWAKRKRELEAKGNGPQPLVHKYFDKSGKRRYKGSRSLKSSESGVPISDESPETLVCRGMSLNYSLWMACFLFINNDLFLELRSECIYSSTNRW